MADINGFDAENYKPLDNFEPIPPARYEAMITASERKTTKAGDGEYLKLEWTVASGEYEGRKIFDNVNLANPNAQAVDLGHRQLATICRAVGKLRINDSEELHGITCIIDVKIRPAKGDWGASNDIKGYEQVGGMIPPQQAAPARTATQAPPATSSQFRAPSSGGQATTAGAAGKPPWAARK